MALRNKRGEIKGVRVNVQINDGDWVFNRVAGGSAFRKGKYYFYFDHEIDDNTIIEVTLTRDALLAILDDLDAHEEIRAEKIADTTIPDGFLVSSVWNVQDFNNGNANTVVDFGDGDDNYETY